MFSGIIKEKGTVNFINKRGNNGVLSVSAPVTQNTSYLGQSISINGLCLTVREINASGLVFDFTPETFLSSTLKYLKVGEKVNIEPALSVDSDLSGHFVLGHVEGIGKITVRKMVKNSFVFGIEILRETGKDISKYMISKGSVCIDGISLTINGVKGSLFFVSIIPFTLDETNLKYKKIGDFVNLEPDILEKTAADRIESIYGGNNRHINVKPGGNTYSNGKNNEITYEFLSEHGFI